MATGSPGCPRGSRLAVSPNAPFAVVADETRKFYAIQFHPEVMHTPQGARSSATSCATLPAAGATGP